MSNVSRIVDRAISDEDTARLEVWEKSERRRKRGIIIRKAKCTIETLLWPLTPKIFAFMGTAVASVCFVHLQTLPETAIYLSWMFLFSLIFAMKIFIACLLRYRGWLTAGRMTFGTKVWGMLMSYSIPASTTTHCFDHLLPPLPFPNPLKVTVNKFVQAMKPVLNQSEIEDLEEKADTFVKTVGWKLHAMLIMRAMFKWNWFSDWWSKYAYLASRGPLFQSSCAGSDSYCVKYNRMDRIAVWTYGIWKYFVEGRHNGQLEQLKLNGVIPLCMDGVKYLTGSVRLPGKGIDEYVWHDPLKTGYIIVRSCGHYYKLHMYDDVGNMLCPGTIKILFEQIWIDSNMRDAVEVDPAIFTTLPRDEWHATRETLKRLAPDALKDVEEAAFLVNFEDEFSDHNGDYFLFGTHGYGHVWYDKSLTFSSFKSGRISTIFEHSGFDGLIMAVGKDFAAIEEFYAHQINGFSWFDKKGLNSAETGVFNAGGFREPSFVNFGDLSSMVPQIERARSHFNEVALNIRVGHMLADNVNRSIAKKVKVSPDALIQMALLIAYHKMHREFVLTYQPATLQHFTAGRTENVRPLTQLKCEFVLAMEDNEIDNLEKFKRLKKAADEHSDLTKAAMGMKGVDRHLFALYIIMKGKGYASEFLDFVFSRGMEMPLCTSCLPNKTLDTLKKASKFDQDWMKNPNAGVFRHQSENGYGVFYMEADSSRTKFVVTGSKTSEKTDPKQFCLNLLQAFDDINIVMESQYKATSA